MAPRASADPLPYISNEICLAAGISRGTLDSWLLRYLPLAAGHPGKGTERRFSLLDGVRICALAELTGIGVPASAAAMYASHAASHYPKHTVMILRRPKKGVTPMMSIVPFGEIKGLLGRGAAIIDLSAIAADTQRILGDPATKALARMRMTVGWAGATGEKVRLAVIDPSVQDTPAEPAPVQKRAKPARKRKLEPA